MGWFLAFLGVAAFSALFAIYMPPAKPAPLPFFRAHEIAKHKNDPSLLDAWLKPVNLVGFPKWLIKYRRTAAHFLAEQPMLYAEALILSWDGDWLLYWPHLDAGNVPENARHWFWSPPACPGRVYMYLRSHPDKLKALYSNPSNS